MIRPCIPPALRRIATPAALLACGLTCPIQAQKSKAPPTYFPKNAVISSAVRGTARIGYATSRDFENLTNPTSPTVSLVQGARLPSQLTVRNHSTVNMSGGTVAEDIVAVEASTINISGGTVGKDIIVFDNGTVNVRGGSIKGNFQVWHCEKGRINLYGTGLKAVHVRDDATLTTATGSRGPYTLYTLSGRLQDGTDISGKALYAQETDGAKFALHNAPAPHSSAH